MILGNVSSVLSVAAFGLSGSYGQAVAARAVGGALNAIILCAKAIIGALQWRFFFFCCCCCWLLPARATDCIGTS